jgi:hypothetical protein
MNSPAKRGLYCTRGEKIVVPPIDINNFERELLRGWRDTCVPRSCWRLAGVRELRGSGPILIQQLSLSLYPGFPRDAWVDPGHLFLKRHTSNYPSTTPSRSNNTIETCPKYLPLFGRETKGQEDMSAPLGSGLDKRAVTHFREENETKFRWLIIEIKY